MDGLLTDQLPRRVAWFAPWTWKRQSIAVAAVPVLLVAYIASIGPAVRLIEARLLNAADIAAVYRPLLITMDRATLVKKPLAAYMDFWSVQGSVSVAFEHLSRDYEPQNAPMFRIPMADEVDRDPESDASTWRPGGDSSTR